MARRTRVCGKSCLKELRMNILRKFLFVLLAAVVVTLAIA